MTQLTKAQMLRLQRRSPLRLSRVDQRAIQVYRDPDDGQQYSLQFGVYQFLIAGVASAASDDDIVQVQNSHSFRIEALTGAAFVSNAYVENPYATFNIQDNGSDQYLFDEAVPFSSIIGTGRLPFILPTPYVVQPAATLTALVNNVSSAAAATFYITLLGSKIKRLSKAA